MKKLLVILSLCSIGPVGCLSTGTDANGDALVAGAEAEASQDGTLLDAFGVLADGGFGGGRGPGEGFGDPFGAALSDEQIAQLRALREQLRSGEISFEEFRAQAETISGITLPSEGFGGPFPGGLEGLTDEQRTQLEALHAQLTAEEITFEEFRTQVETIIGQELPEPPFGGEPGGFPGGFGHRGGMGFPGGGAQPTEEQRAAIEALIAQLRGGEIDQAQFRERVRAIFEAGK
ncbi:MAG: hypothetical protein SF069_07775 [Phycisphaerae bacterium]|nr:hypothetical protein [Phycisphaerae bacterium]